MSQVAARQQHMLASQAESYRMKIGPKAENGNKLPQNRIPYQAAWLASICCWNILPDMLSRVIQVKENCVTNSDFLVPTFLGVICYLDASREDMEDT